MENNSKRQKELDTVDKERKEKAKKDDCNQGQLHPMIGISTGEQLTCSLDFICYNYYSQLITTISSSYDQ